MSGRRIAVSVAVAASLLLVPAAALAHGGEEEAAAEVPARSFAQQALALLTQADDPAEATEKLEAALQSEDKMGIDLTAVREALAALKADDHELAVEHLNAALGAGEVPAAPTGEALPAGEGAEPGQGAAPAGEAQAAAGTLDHAEELEPDRGTAEWVALAVGIALAGGALALLAIPRRAG